MSGRNIVLTGIPRAGTTLCCSLLGQAADTVALFEPMAVHALPRDPGRALEVVAAFFNESRRTLLERGVATSQQVAGQVPDNPFGQERDQSGARTRVAHLGQIQVSKPLSQDFSLVIKHNAAFTALLPELAQRFECYCIVRNPLAVLASWNSVNLPVSAGRLPAGEHFDQALSRRLDAQPDLLERQLHLLDWLFGRFTAHLPAERILRYEDIVHSAGAALAAATSLPVPPLALQNQNASRLYDLEQSRRHAAGLLAGDGCWRQFYSDGDVLQGLQAMQAAS